MKNVTKTLMLMFALSVQTIVAQTSNNDTKAEQDATAQKPADEKEINDKRTANERKTKPSKQVFKPTEEISEDSPVPFPVDI